jgi:SAM-dependent methyltransferase
MDYKTNYKGYESLASFNGPEHIKAYREELLNKTDAMVGFISRHMGPTTLKVFEVGCGNGRLLVGLHKAGRLFYGDGIDISCSRIEFAEDWARSEANPLRIRFENQDALEIQLPTSRDAHKYDLSVCITGCLQYFPHIGNEALTHTLDLLSLSARHTLIEVYRQPPEGKTWHRLADTDPWMYLLDEYVGIPFTFYPTMRHDKIFIKRDGTEDVRTEYLTYWDATRLEILLTSHNMRPLTIHETDTTITVLTENVI